HEDRLVPHSTRRGSERRDLPGLELDRDGEEQSAFGAAVGERGAERIELGEDPIPRGDGAALPFLLGQLSHRGLTSVERSTPEALSRAAGRAGPSRSRREAWSSRGRA